MHINLKYDWLVVVPKGEGASIMVFDYRDEIVKPPKPIGLQTAQAKVFEAILNGYSVHKEEHESHTRIFIVSEEEVTRKRKIFEKGFMK